MATWLTTSEVTEEITMASRASSVSSDAAGKPAQNHRHRRRCGPSKSESPTIGMKSAGGHRPLTTAPFRRRRPSSTDHCSLLTSPSSATLPCLQISSGPFPYQWAVRLFTLSNPSTHWLIFKAQTFFLTEARFFPATSSNNISHPFSHSSCASQSSTEFSVHSVQLQFLASPFMIGPTQDPVQTGLQGLHLAPLSGPGLDSAATGTPNWAGGNSYSRSVTIQNGRGLVVNSTFWVVSWALKADSELSSPIPAEGLRRASKVLQLRNEVFGAQWAGPVPVDSCSDDPVAAFYKDEILQQALQLLGNRTALANTKNKNLYTVGRVGSRQNPDLRLSLGYGFGFKYSDSSYSGCIVQQQKLVRVRIQRAVEKKIRIFINTKNPLHNERPGQLEPAGPGPRPPNKRRFSTHLTGSRVGQDDGRSGHGRQIWI
ncbi:leucine--tRNA ligase [Striga asiatica]|uniref:Leucine--tRNA ligase n=1 Tax=Striga asiatica TaxID=4170 RepID=A0A5A7Q485_STRAF|nr:leucine--tRNA ligase [Striga asiatica]